MPSKVMFIVSACLADIPCRYDGKSNSCNFVLNLYRHGKCIPICPEVLAGLSIPRDPCEIREGRVITIEGLDLTDLFAKGAELALQRALSFKCSKAILKSRSPSCGYGKIYDGTFSHTLCNGNGLWTEKLIAAGYEIFTENNLPQLYQNQDN